MKNPVAKNLNKFNRCVKHKSKKGKGSYQRRSKYHGRGDPGHGYFFC